MGIIRDVKETTRKATNTVVDKTENIVGITKSPKELAKRVIEHLTHREYKEIANMLTSEAKKYLDKMDLEDNELAKEKLADFEETVNALAIDIENHDYKQVVAEFEKLEKALPEKAIKAYPVLGSIKDTLKSLIDSFKKQVKSGASNVKPKFEDMLETLEKSFKDFAQTK